MKNLLIIRLDGIGDYILFRNFLEILRKSCKYKNYNITLCANIVWKNLVETFDADFVDEFIWIDRSIFHTDREYRHSIFNLIKQKSFDVAINPIFSREYISNTLIKLSNAKHKIGSVGDETNMTKAEKVVSDSYYTELLPAVDSNIFEFYRNKEFFENLLQIKLAIEKPSLDINNVKISQNLPLDKFAVIFPDTGAEFRQWNLDNYAQIADFLFDNYGLHIVIAGGEKFKDKSQELISKISTDNITNITGNKSLSEFAKIISSASLLVSGDTGAYHMAAALNTKVVCISNGNTYGRFVPYPEELSEKVAVVFPPEIQNNFMNQAFLHDKYRYASILDINNITVESVKSQIKELYNA